MAADPGYSSSFWLNIAQGWTLTRSADDTHTRVRGADPYTTTGQVIELLVLETPAQIMALAEAARDATMQVVTVQVRETVEEILALIA